MSKFYTKVSYKTSIYN